MKTPWMLVPLLFSGNAAQAAGACNPADLAGPYAFQLSGTTDISGSPKPTVSLGRITFGERGALSGTASAAFRGLLLGNPVTGSYEAKTDCSVTWKLQDDSGGFQNFSGTLSGDGGSLTFTQTDPGGAQRGTMKKMPASCTTATLGKKYAFTVSGSTTPMSAGQVARTVSAKGTLDIGANFQLESDCSVTFTLTPDQQPTMNMRGFVVNGGREILAFQTDPGAMVWARLVADGM